MLSTHFGCLEQIGSITSETKSAVVAGFSDTATGAGGAGICTDIIGGPPVGVPDCAAALVAPIAKARLLNSISFIQVILVPLY
jgi:hypothetical protein